MKILGRDQGSVFGDGCFSQHARRDSGVLELILPSRFANTSLGIA